MESITTNTSFVANVEKINDEYEYIQYNEKLRLIHSIKDDMYQMQSIIKACNSKKPCKDWFRNQSTQELLDEMLGLAEFRHTNELSKHAIPRSNQQGGLI